MQDNIAEQALAAPEGSSYPSKFILKTELREENFTLDFNSGLFPWKCRTLPDFPSAGLHTAGREAKRHQLIRH